MRRIKQILFLAVLTLGLAILPALVSNNQVYAATVTKTEQMVITFGTNKIYSEDGQVFDIGFSYEMHPKSNESNTLSETVRLQNGATISTSSKTLTVKVYDAEGKEFTGSFSFNYSYNSATGVLLVNNSAVSFSTHILVNATVFPEAWMEPKVISVGMNPLPFSQVKALAGQGSAYVTEFDNRANAGITENIVLKTSQYGTNIQTDTKLAMWITFWERNVNGSYNMNIPKVTHQVIYSAADIINGKATSNN